MHSVGWATLVENIMDPAHVNFSHHNVIGDRCHSHTLLCLHLLP